MLQDNAINNASNGTNMLVSSQTDLISLISHQLRTPLGIIKWSVELLRRGGHDQKDPELKNYVDKIFQSNDKALYLVNTLLLTSRIEQGRIMENLESVEVKKTLQEVINSMQFMATSRKVNLNLQGDDAITTFIDKTQLVDVFHILLRNAIQYANEASTIEINLQSDNSGKMLISIKDVGLGLSDNEKANLFTKYFRSEDAKRLNPEGIGLGLFIAKSYAENWGGQISLEINNGCTATLTLPINSATQ